MDAFGIPDPAGWEDPLTGLEGPDFWQRILVAELARSVRYRRELTVVIVELRGVQELADAAGIDVARHAVRAAGQAIRRNSRTSDYCIRLGPSRFGVVLTETGEIAAINFVERVRESGPAGGRAAAPGLCFAFGWASPRPGESADSLVRRAEARLLAEVVD